MKKREYMDVGTEFSAEKKRYSLGEEIFNSVSHGVCGIAAAAGTAVLIVVAVIYSDAWAIVSCAVYGASLIILYAMSTLYHAITNKTAKRFFRIMDHNSIFILIAGTYTPFTLVTLRGVTGWVLFGIIWGAAVIGIILNTIDLEKFKNPSVICYVLMGLAIFAAIKPMYDRLPALSFVFLVLGGAFYILGILFYAVKSIKYFHSIWHLFTIAGSAFHYFSVLLAIID